MERNGSDKVTVWWIDDNHADATGPKERAALENPVRQSLNLVAIHPAEFGDYEAILANQLAPDLMLFDFRLGMRQHSTKVTPFFARDGVTLRSATLGIQELRKVPAYLVSRVANEAQTGSSDDHFDWVLSHEQLFTKLGGAFLLADAKDYRRLQHTLAATSESDDPSEVQQSLVAAIRTLLRVPEASVESVELLIGHTIRTVLRSESILDSGDMKLAPSRPRAIAQWVRSSLQRLRGPLIDELSAATMLGANLEYFKTVLQPSLDLGSVKYSGMFCRTVSMTLWREALLRWLLSQSPSIQLSTPTILAQSAAKFLDVPEGEQATCRVCKNRWPEAIAFDEDDPSVEAAVHWRCSTEAADIDSIFGFDIPRSFCE